MKSYEEIVHLCGEYWLGLAGLRLLLSDPSVHEREEHRQAVETAWELAPKARDRMDPSSRDCWDAVLPLLRQWLEFLGYAVSRLPPWPPASDHDRPNPIWSIYGDPRVLHHRDG